MKLRRRWQRPHQAVPPRLAPPDVKFFRRSIVLERAVKNLLELRRLEACENDKGLDGARVGLSRGGGGGGNVQF